MNVSVEDLQNEIGRLHIQVMAYEKERVRLVELVKSLSPASTPVVETPKV